MNLISTTTVTTLVMIFIASLTSSSPAEEISAVRKAVTRQQGQIDALSQRLKDFEYEERSKFAWNLGVFGDINYSTNSREHAHNSFSLGNITLYSSANYGERLTFLVELDFESHKEVVDLERAWVGYTVSDLLAVRAGKNHTALGYWNKTYHHGKQLFHTVDRPFFLVFEHDNGVLPTHITGIEVEGGKTFAFGRVKYELQFGNGPSLADESGASQGVLNPNNASDDNDSKQPVIRISFRPVAIQGLSAGLFATSYEVDTTTRKRLEETIYGMDLLYSRGGLEIISEGFLFNNQDGAGNAFYIQLAYTEDAWTPYIGFESLEVQESDPYFKDLTGGIDRSQAILGVKYDIDPLISSLKFQYRHDDGARDYDVFETQWAFHF